MRGAQQRIANILSETGSITNWYCIDNRITTRLSSVIQRLRIAGWVITTEIMENKNCRYTLVSKGADMATRGVKMPHTSSLALNL